MKPSATRFPWSIDAPRNDYVVLIGRTDLLTDPMEKRKPYVVMSHLSYRRADEAIRIAELPFDPEGRGRDWVSSVDFAFSHEPRLRQ